MRENRGSRGNVNCLVCPGFLLPARPPVHKPPLPPSCCRPHAHSLTHLHTPPLPKCLPHSLPSLQGLRSHLSGENQDLKMWQAYWSGARQMVAQECRVADKSRGVGSPHGRYGSRWQRPGQGETGFQRQESSPWKEPRPQAGNQAGTLFPEMGHPVEVQWQRTKLEPSYKNRQQSWEWPAGRKWSIYNRRKSGTTLMSKSRGLF